MAEKSSPQEEVSDFSLAKEQANIVAMINKKVTIGEKVVRGKKQTYVTGLEVIDKYATDSGLKDLSGKLKKSFGCGCHVTKDEDGNNMLIFQGNHKSKIYAYLKKEHPNVNIA